MADSSDLIITADLDGSRIATAVEKIKKKLQDLNKTVKDFGDGIKEGFQEGFDSLQNDGAINNTSKGLEKASKSAKSFSKNIKQAGGHAKSAKSGLLSLVKAGIGITSVAMAFKLLKNAIKDGLQNLVKYDSETNQSISGLVSALATLKNALATAFAPILNVVAPILTKFVNMLVEVANKVAYFMALITGRSSFVKATAVQTDYAKSLDKTGASAKKASKYLSGLDEIATWKSDKDSSGGGGGASSPFETIQIDEGDIAKWKNLKKLLNDIKDIFMDGFKAGLGDWKSKVDDIKKNLASIKDSLREIFTDPNVVASAKAMVKKIVYALGQIVGATVSIGLTIAQNIVGGIAKFLEQKKDYLKKRLADIFDVTGEIAEIAGNYAEAFARVFDVFGEENGQQLTANIIGIFVTAFTELLLLAEKIGRDVLNFITKPFIDNQQGFKEAIDNTLGFLADITGLIQKGLEDLGEALNNCYDEHVKPFMDNITEDASELVGKVLDWWNTDIKPILDSYGKKFAETYNTHVKPTIDKIAEAFGKVMDALDKLREKFKPILDFCVGGALERMTEKIDHTLQLINDGIKLICDIIQLFADTFTGASEIVIALLEGDWQTAINSWGEMWVRQINDVKEALRELLDMLSVKWEESFLGRTVNGIKDKITSAKTTVKTQSYNGMPSNVPHLATGAVIPPNAPFLATLGDQRNGTNFEAPEGLLRQVVREEAGGRGGSYEFVAQINRRTLFDEMISEARLRQSASGRNPFEFA